MTRDEIIHIARKAGATPYTNRHFPDRPFHTFSPEQLEVFAALVAATEREKFVNYPKGDVAGPCICGGWPGGGCLRCEVIISRGQE